MGRPPLTGMIGDARRAGVAALWLVFGVCLCWLVASVWWSLRDAAAPAKVAATLPRLWAFGPPILGLLASAALINSGRKEPERASATGPSSEVLKSLEPDSDLDPSVQRAIERAEQTAAALRSLRGAADQASAESGATIEAVQESLQRIDALSRTTTSLVAERAYALDAALGGVLARTDEVFAALSDRVEKLADEGARRLSRTLAGEVEGAATVLKALERRVAAARSLMIDDHCPVDPIAAALHDTRVLTRRLTTTPEPCDAARGRAPPPSGPTLAPGPGEFIAVFEAMLGRILAAGAPDQIAKALLASDIGRLYLEEARRLGRLP